MSSNWTSYQSGDDFEDAVCFPRGCREQYLVHPDLSHSYLADRGVILSGISHFVKPYSVQRTNPGYHVLLLSVGGKGDLVSQGKSRIIKQGDLIIAPRMTSYRYKASAEWSCVWFHLEADAAWSTFFPKEVTVVQSRHVEFISSLSKQYLAERKDRFVDAHSVERALANLITMFVDRELRQLGLSRKDQNTRSRIELVWEKVVADLAHPWTISSLARLAGMSSSQFTRHVNRFYRDTPMSIVLNFRMQRSREMLTFTNHTLEAIAANVGYETAFSFSRAFKRHVGKSPSDYRSEMNPG